ncbi:MAG: threonine--tRNA ligase [bacterium]|nr:threonine--tRNA ligase [bacterium]
MEKKASLDEIRHSLAHILAAAVLKKYPDTQLGIGPVIENGFYYDFKFTRPISEADLGEFEKEMRQLVKASLPFSGKKITPVQAGKTFKGQPFKLDLIKEFTKDKKPLTLYTTGDVFTDLCRGGHVKNTSEINPDSFKLTKLAGAYWRGDEKNPMLTRIYAVAFNTKQELDAHLLMLAEAEKRDHKKLGTDLDLFVFSPLVGPGLPLWTPKGTILRDTLDNFVWELREKNGYERVDIPHIAKKALYEKSGHWEKFRDDIFTIMSREGHTFVLKPMNCPHHTQIYAAKPRSYKELPIRYANTTKVYRDEQTGELAGLTRVRSITQDDAHVFCREIDIENELGAIWNMISEFYAKFGFTLAVRLSFHDPKNPKNYLGTPALWKKSEATLTKLAHSKGIPATEARGEAAFYGPKVDFIAKDSLGRDWQVATIQLDLNLPERFDLTCTNETGKSERIVMIHAAIMGSLERFIATLIEHTAGVFPTWVAPIQAIIVPISEKQKEYAQKVFAALKTHGVRVRINDANETLGKRIRESEMQKIPYILVVGDKEIQAESIAVRRYGKGDLGVHTINNFIEKIVSEIKNKKAA